MSDARRAFDEFAERLEQSVAARDDVLGLVLVGSAAERSRVDEWSDHDFFLVVADGHAESYRRDLSWLPDPHRIVLAPRETAHGLKVVYDDAHVLEFAVATPAELSTFAGNVYEVVIDRERVAERMLADVVRTPQPADAADEVGLFLADLLIGAGRARRGEQLAGGRSVRTAAVGHLVRAVALVAGSHDDVRRDGLDPLRRIEQVQPGFASAVADAVARPVDDAARALLDLSDAVIGDWDGYPAGAVAVVRRRLGWNEAD